MEPGNPVKLITEKIERSNEQEKTVIYKIYQDTLSHRLLYNVENFNEKDVIVITFSPNTGIQYQNVYNDKSMEQVIQELLNLWKNGRFVGLNNSVTQINGAISRIITYKGVRRILDFERPFHSNIPFKPTEITQVLDLGNYLVEAWGGNDTKRSYSYLTFSKETDLWLIKISGFFGFPKKDKFDIVQTIKAWRESDNKTT